MPITIQGNWTITVQQKSPQSLPQRFIISGATSGNGTYLGVIGATPVNIVGNNWQINIQANESYESDGQWINSTIRALPTQTVGNQYVLILESEDLIQDNSYDDLVLRLTSPVKISPPPAPKPNEIPSPPFVEPPPPAPVTPNVPPPVIKPPVKIEPGKVFERILIEDKLPIQKEIKTYGIWSNNVGNLTNFYTCSYGLDNSSYNLTIFNDVCNSCSSEVQFSISYGHDDGSGSKDLGGYDWCTPTNAIYGMYRNLCLDKSQNRFMIGKKEMYHFYALNIDKNRMGDKIDEGNIEINIAHLSGSEFLAGGGNRNAHTGSNVKLSGTNKILRLIDDSKLDISKLSTTSATTTYAKHKENSFLYEDSGPVFYMVSGSLEDGIYNNTNPTAYGLLYPNLGVILLDADMLDASASFLTVTGSDVNGENTMKLFTAISGAAKYTDLSGDVLGFQARRKELLYTEHYYIRVKNFDFNFTNNPTYQKGTEGEISDDFLGNPKVFITTVGLYNEQKELLAIGKLSRPVQKDYVTEALFTLKLSY
jgi:hypothetical protein